MIIHSLQPSNTSAVAHSDDEDDDDNDDDDDDNNNNNNNNNTQKKLPSYDAVTRMAGEYIPYVL